MPMWNSGKEKKARAKIDAALKTIEAINEKHEHSKGSFKGSDLYNHSMGRNIESSLRGCLNALDEISKTTKGATKGE